MTGLVTILAVTVAIVVTAVCVGLTLQVRVLRAQAEALRERVDALGPLPAAPPAVSASLGSRPRRVLVLEILNPVELATAQVKAAAVLGAVRPQLLTKIVYDQAAKQVVTQLEEQGVQADVTVHVVR